MRVWYKVKDPIEQLQIFIATLLLINWLGDGKTVPELEQKVLRVVVGNQSGDLSWSWHLATLTNWPSGMNIREARNQSAVRGQRVQAQWELSEYNQYLVCQAVITQFLVRQDWTTDSRHLTLSLINTQTVNRQKTALQPGAWSRPAPLQSLHWCSFTRFSDAMMMFLWLSSSNQPVCPFPRVFSSL